MFEYTIWQTDAPLEALNGLTITSIEGLEKDSEIVLFTTKCGRQFKMFHDQDCCESVSIDDVCGDVTDLIDAKISHFEERSEEGDGDEWGDTSTWTFYDMQTTKGSVNIKWLGTSNGYYSETVSFIEGKKPEEDE